MIIKDRLKFFFEESNRERYVGLVEVNINILVFVWVWVLLVIGCRVIIECMWVFIGLRG